MTFKALWTALKTTWQSRPLALILPVIALAVFWWTHGHTWTKASFPTFGEWIAGTTLLFAKFGRVMAVFVGEADPATLPPPVVAPLLKPPGVPPVVLLLAFLGLALGGSGCATVTPIVKDVETCAGPACADLATKLLPAAEVILECELATAGAALPACAENGLVSLAAAAGPDGWKIVACIVNAIEKDATKPPAVRARARLAVPVVAMHRALGR